MIRGVAGGIVLWLSTFYLPALAALWCRLGLVTPAGHRHLLWALPGAAVGWTAGAIIIDVAVLVCALVLLHAGSQIDSERVTNEQGRPRTEWTLPGKRMVSIYLCVIGAALVAAGIGAGMQFGWGRSAAVPLTVLGVVVITGRGRRFAPARDAEDNNDDPAGDTGALRRLRSLLITRKGEVGATLVPKTVKYGSDKSLPLLGYSIKACSVGFFSTAEGQSLLKRLCTELPGTEWTYDLQSGSDIARFEHPETKHFPPIAVPHPDMFWSVKSVAEATQRYSQFKLPFGVDEAGEPVEFSLKDFPHMALVGESGSGKTIFLSTLLEFFLAAGWGVAIGDGKMVDYGPVRDKVILVTKTDEQYARLIHWAWQEMQDRKVEMDHRLANEIPGSGDFPPLVVILDEFAAVYLRLQARFGGEFDDIMSKVSQMQKEGRQLCVHLIFASQSFRNSDFPRWILDACPLKVSLGPPNNITIGQAFQEPVRDRAQYLGGKMRGRKGRGLVDITDAPPEKSLREFQSWWGYSPATPDTATRKNPAKVKQQHAYLRDYVSGRVPKLYARQWFKVESAKDWELTYAEICALPTVSLDRDDGTPDPTAFCYDPTHRSYNGRSKGGRKWGKELKVLTK